MPRIKRNVTTKPKTTNVKVPEIVSYKEFNDLIKPLRIQLSDICSKQESHSGITKKDEYKASGKKIKIKVDECEKTSSTESKDGTRFSKRLKQYGDIEEKLNSAKVSEKEESPNKSDPERNIDREHSSLVESLLSEFKKVEKNYLKIMEKKRWQTLRKNVTDSHRIRKLNIKTNENKEGFNHAQGDLNVIKENKINRNKQNEIPLKELFISDFGNLEENSGDKYRDKRSFGAANIVHIEHAEVSTVEPRSAENISMTETKICPKQLVVKVVQMDHTSRRDLSPSRTEESEDKRNCFFKAVQLKDNEENESPLNASKEIIINLVRYKNNKKKNKHVIVTEEENIQSVNKIGLLKTRKEGNVELLNGKKLRKRQPKDYIEESVPEVSDKSDLTPKKQGLPIYRMQLPEEVQKKTKQQDLYEFEDFSPKRKKERRKSSILYDKDTFDILRKIEAKEIKMKKRAVRKKKPVSVKRYEQIVNGIIKNVMEKVQKKNQTDIVDQKVNKRVVQINNFQDEVNVFAHGSKIKDPNGTTRKQIGPEQDILTNGSDYNDVSLNEIDNHSDDLDIPESDPKEEDTIKNCFGFSEDSPKPSPIKIISNVIIRHTSTPVKFQGINKRRPNANSTMLSPWRMNWITTRPRFLSVKNNALPRIDQEMVLDHALVKDFEESCSKICNNTAKSSPKKSPVQQSILDFVQSNMERGEKIIERSLFDYDEFNSPVKANIMNKENAGVERVKKNFGRENIILTTPVQRRALGDISNSSETLSSRPKSHDSMFFGFDDTDLISGRKQRENDENDLGAKPSRFDPSGLRNYSVKKRKVKEKPVAEAEQVVKNDLDNSISVMEDSQEHDDKEYRLFDEPEDFLDIDLSVKAEKKRRRRRLNSTNSDASDMELKQKKHKKTKLEEAQEKWIEEFNRQCDEIDGHDLILE